ncbi:class I SAM-dependent methyltransferase [Lederbergia sp. NSJ-179]|uniref:class I SAM-dependent methyltransferase n=1 Tax=Lederbergia sp. NSJ-179 TaxID=2931402 RepID=UPI001FD1ABDF|nr:class I SAM-dependent methyltransferase [Lederbergia sp. NSJ-179]MCJ7840014.1 class I SAM-dependent methyltransferase [Lederbergia sp. NSJ-179]
MNEKWHERFSSDEYFYGKEPNLFLVEVEKILPKGKILCIAEGEGRNSVFLASQGYDVTAWDFAQAGLDKTKKLAHERGVVVKTELHDLANVEWEEEQWDAIIHIFGHFPTPIFERTMQGIRRALKPGGYYVGELYTKEQIRYGTGGPKEIDNLCDPGTLLERFSGYFIQHFYIGEVERIEGQGHTGVAHVVQSIFQKR